MSNSSKKKDMMWVYMLQLSNNMWGDPGTKCLSPYTPEVITDDAAWRAVVDFLPSQGFNTVLIDLGDAVQYETHPEIAIKGAWSKDKLKKELDHMRSIGLTPIPKLNFAAAHDTWLGVYSRMLSTPQYYQVCKDLITEVAELFDYPEYFHLGMDEENYEYQKALSYLVIRQKDLLWHDMYYLFDVCEKLGMRPWIWSDLFWEEKTREDYMKRMPKSVLQSSYYYVRVWEYPGGPYLNPLFDVYLDLNKHGFEQVPTGTTIYGNDTNMEEQMLALKEELDPSLLKGYMTAPWYGIGKYDKYRHMNEAVRFYVGKKSAYPEHC